jgi:hypothetical protein
MPIAHSSFQIGAIVYICNEPDGEVWRSDANIVLSSLLSWIAIQPFLLMSPTNSTAIFDIWVSFYDQ